MKSSWTFGTAGMFSQDRFPCPLGAGNGSAKTFGTSPKNLNTIEEM